MNWYRNAQHFESNQVKKQFKALVASQLKDVELEVPVWVKYQVFKPSKRRLDKMNVASVTSKFVLDALSEFGVIPDDNDDYIKDEIILPTVHDKEDERVIVEFITVEEKDIG
jgi:Holliday junction resolvase RusA-like endonuclease